MNPGTATDSATRRRCLVREKPCPASESVSASVAVTVAMAMLQVAVTMPVVFLVPVAVTVVFLVRMVTTPGTLRRGYRNRHPAAPLVPMDPAPVGENGVVKEPPDVQLEGRVVYLRGSGDTNALVQDPCAVIRSVDQKVCSA